MNVYDLTNITNNLTYKSTFNMWNHIRMRTHNLDPASLIIFILCLYVIYLLCVKARANNHTHDHL